MIILHHLGSLGVNQILPRFFIPKAINRQRTFLAPCSKAALESNFQSHKYSKNILLRITLVHAQFVKAGLYIFLHFIQAILIFFQKNSQISWILNMQKSSETTKIVFTFIFETFQPNLYTAIPNREVQGFAGKSL